MNKPILSPRDLALANLAFWRGQCERLSSLRQFSLAQGAGQLCINLQSAHDLAVHRCQRANKEYLRAKNGGRA